MNIASKYKYIRDVALFMSKLNLIGALGFFFNSTFFGTSNFVAVISGYAAIAISLYPLFSSLRKKDVSLALNCISLFNIAPIWFLYLESVIPGNDAYNYIDPEYRIKALMWSSFFLFFVNFSYAKLAPIIIPRAIRFFTSIGNLKLKYTFFQKGALLTFCIPLLFFLHYYGSLGGLWTALTIGRSGGGGSGLLKRESVGDTSSLLLPITWLWQLVPLFGSLAFIEGRKKSPLISYVSLGMAFFVVFISFLGGSRGGMMLVAAPMVFFLFYYNLDKGLRFWIFAGVLAVMFIGIMELQVRFRGGLLDVLKNPTAAAKAKGYASATTFDATESHRDNNMYLFCLMIKGYPAKYHYEGFNDFFAVLLNPIPRAIWPGKPLLSGAKDVSTLHQFVLDGPLVIGTSSLTVSVVGNGYLTDGIIGIFVFSMVYTLFLLWFDGLLYYTSHEKPLVVGIFGIGVFLSFWGFRGLFALVGFLYPILFLIVIMRFIKTK